MAYNYQKMLNAGHSKKEIIEYLTKETQMNPRAFYEAGKSEDYILDKLSKQKRTVKAPITAESLKTKGILGKVGEFLGSEKLGRGLGARLATALDPNVKKNLQMAVDAGIMTDEEKMMVETGGVSKKGMAGSAIQTGLSLATPFAGKALSTAGGIKNVMKAMGVSSALMGSFSGAKALSEEGDLDDIMKAAAIGGVIGALIPPAGMALQWGAKQVFKTLPLRVYQQFFKNSEKEFLRESQERIGMIPKSTTTAEYALKQGRMGSIGDILDQTLVEARDLNKKVIGMAQKGKPVNFTGVYNNVKIDKSKVAGLLGEIADTYSAGAAGKLSPEGIKATTLLKQLVKTKGNTVPADMALEVRRFLDGMIKTSSWNKITSGALPLKTSAVKNTANALRSFIEQSNPKLANKIATQSLLMSSIEELAKEGARRGNAKLLNLTDAFLGGTSMAYQNPFAGVGLMTGFRAAQTPTIYSALAQGLTKTANLAEKVAGTNLPANLGTLGGNTAQAIRQAMYSRLSPNP